MAQLSKIMESLRAEGVGTTELLAKSKASGDVVKVDGEELATQNDVATINSKEYNVRKSISVKNVLTRDSYPVKKGEVVWKYDNGEKLYLFYRAKVDIPEYESWNESKWERIDLNTILMEKAGYDYVGGVANELQSSIDGLGDSLGKAIEGVSVNVDSLTERIGDTERNVSGITQQIPLLVDFSKITDAAISDTGLGRDVQEGELAWHLNFDAERLDLYVALKDLAKDTLWNEADWKAVDINEVLKGKATLSQLEESNRLLDSMKINKDQIAPFEDADYTSLGEVFIDRADGKLKKCVVDEPGVHAIADTSVAKELNGKAPKGESYTKTEVDEIVGGVESSIQELNTGLSNLSDVVGTKAGKEEIVAPEDKTYGRKGDKWVPIEGGGGGASTWDEISGKPTEFPPSAHVHSMEDVEGLEAALDSKAGSEETAEALEGKANSVHTHSIDDVEGLGDALAGKAGVDSLPTKTSELENDSGYITSEDLPSVPSKTSELENDSGFITAEEVPSTSVYHDDTMTGDGASEATKLSVKTMTGSKVYPSKGRISIGNNDYSFVRIGNKLWMAENLREPIGVFGTDYKYPNKASEYNFPIEYGYLYTMSSLYSDANVLTEAFKAILPNGWRLPTESDWADLVSQASGDASRLKADSPVWNPVGSNALGFAAFPVGYNHPTIASTNWYYLQTAAFWERSFRSDKRLSYFRCLTQNSNSIGRSDNWNYGFASVRLVADVSEEHDGTKGLVPKPKIADYDKVLSGAGEWISVAKQSDIADEAKARNEADSALAQAINDTDTEVATNKATMEENFRGVNSALALKVNEEDVYTKSEIDGKNFVASTDVTNIVRVTELPSNPDPNTLYIVVEGA